MDVWVNFTHAAKWQAEGIFKYFFSFKPTAVADAAAPATPKDPSQQNPPLPKRKFKTHVLPRRLRLLKPRLLKPRQQSPCLVKPLHPKAPHRR